MSPARRIATSRHAGPARSCMVQCPFALPLAARPHLHHSREPQTNLPQAMSCTSPAPRTFYVPSRPTPRFLPLRLPVKPSALFAPSHFALISATAPTLRLRVAPRARGGALRRTADRISNAAPAPEGERKPAIRAGSHIQADVPPRLLPRAYLGIWATLPPV